MPEGDLTMTFFDLFVLILGLSCVWEVLVNRAAFAAGVGATGFPAVNLAASVWLLAVLAVSGPPLLLAVLKLPCVVVFFIAVWRSAPTHRGRRPRALPPHPQPEGRLMSTLAILAVSVCALLAWCALVQGVKEVLAARARPPACPCRDLTSLALTPGAVFDIPAGTKLQPGADPASLFASYRQTPKETVSCAHLVLSTSTMMGKSTERDLGQLAACRTKPNDARAWLDRRRQRVTERSSAS